MVKINEEICSVIGKYLSYEEMLQISEADPILFKYFSTAIRERRLSIDEKARTIHESLDDAFKHIIPEIKLIRYGLQSPRVSLPEFLKINYSTRFATNTDIAVLKTVALIYASIHKRNPNEQYFVADLAPAARARFRIEDSHCDFTVISFLMMTYGFMYAFLFFDLMALYKTKKFTQNDKFVHLMFLYCFIITCGTGLACMLTLLRPLPEVTRLKSEIDAFIPNNPMQNEYKLFLLAIHRELNESLPGGFFGLWKLKNTMWLGKVLILLALPAILHGTISMQVPWALFALVFHFDRFGISLGFSRKYYFKPEDQNESIRHLIEIGCLVSLHISTVILMSEYLQHGNHNDFFQKFVEQYIGCDKLYCPAESYAYFISMLMINLGSNLVTNGVDTLRSTDLRRPLNYLYECTRNTNRRATPLYPEYDLEAGKLKIL
jgi:hypothetical protein